MAFYQPVSYLDSFLGTTDRNQLTGKLPEELKSLTRLQTFNLFDNMLTGSIPDVFREYSSLVEFDWRSNLFTGTIPASLGLHTQLTDLRLYDNVLTVGLSSAYSSIVIPLCKYSQIGHRLCYAKGIYPG